MHSNGTKKKTCGFILFEIKSNKVSISNVIKDNVPLAVEMKVRPLECVREFFGSDCISVKSLFEGGLDRDTVFILQRILCFPNALF
jgi:hypothetical protein